MIVTAVKARELYLVMIIKKSNKYEVRSKDGKLLGTHDSRLSALRQLRAIEANKNASKA